MVSEMNHLAQVIGYAVLLFALIVGMAWSFVGVSNLTYKTLWACKYTHDFWGEVYNALWKRWYRDARKRTEGGGG